MQKTWYELQLFASYLYNWDETSCTWGDSVLSDNHAYLMAPLTRGDHSDLKKNEGVSAILETNILVSSLPVGVGQNDLASRAFSTFDWDK